MEHHSHEPTLGWSNIALFAIFENVHYAADQVRVYFYESNSKKICKFGRARGKVFYFQKMTETLKINIFSENLQIQNLSSKNNRREVNLDFHFVLIYFASNTWAKLVLPMVQAKTILGGFSSVFAFKQAKEEGLFQPKLLKIKKNVLLILELQALHPKSRQL